MAKTVEKNDQPDGCPSNSGEASALDSIPGEITRLILDWEDGDADALNHLITAVYLELHKRAHAFLRNESPGHLLQTTALVHEVYLRLRNTKQVEARNRGQFYSLCAKIMRHILIDHARTRATHKRGGELKLISSDEVLEVANTRAAELIALDDALTSLAALDQRKSRVVELRYFAGLTNQQVSDCLKIALDTVHRDWKFAQAWLAKEILTGQSEI